MEAKPPVTQSGDGQRGNASAFNTPRKLVADYSSDESENDDESVDSQPKTVPGPSDSSSEESSCDDDIKDIVRPIEEIKITIPPEESKEVGKIKYIVDNQVVIEPNAGIAALDLDTVLFLDDGKRALGRVEDVFGPITEPLYSVMFASASTIAEKGIVAGMNVYYAPSTDHTSFVFLPDLIKMKGSDASWKHNQEIPSEVQDFSDDEEEAKAGNKVKPEFGKNSPGAQSMPHRRPPAQKRDTPRPHRGPPRSFDRPPSWMPPIRPPVFNLPQYPPQSQPYYNPSVPPPPSPGYNMHQSPYQSYEGGPFSGGGGMSYNSRPGPMHPTIKTEAPPQPGPSVQDMRHWQRQEP